MPERAIRYCEAIGEALDYCLSADPAVYLMGLGVPDPKGVFGTTLGLQAKYGARRVMDMPTSEAGMTGVAIGSALIGMRPVMVHQRLDFALLALDQIVNQAAKWNYMFGGDHGVPLVIRLILGRGWGQGAQHSQNLQSWLAHVPGLKVIAPATPYDAKGMLIAAIEDPAPVLCLEHRWLFNVAGEVPAQPYRVPIGTAGYLSRGGDVTLVASSYMSVEALRAARILYREGIAAEVIDLRSLRPMDEETIVASVRNSGRLIVADQAWKPAGIAAEVVALIAEHAHDRLKAAPIRLTLADAPAPAAPALAARYYPGAREIVAAACRMMGRDPISIPAPRHPHDVPDPDFHGPF
jgi:pyruvate/2-oxoglutarate/acetoin dehydrogenase E1 component